jgi:hypothetical protein
MNEEARLHEVVGGDEVADGTNSGKNGRGITAR